MRHPPAGHARTAERRAVALSAREAESRMTARLAILVTIGVSAALMLGWMATGGGI